MNPEPNACSALSCRLQEEPVTVCRDLCCPYCWQREGREDRAKREACDSAASKPVKKVGLPDR